MSESQSGTAQCAKGRRSSAAKRPNAPRDHVNFLVSALDGKSEDQMDGIVADDTAMCDPELNYALTYLFCLEIERGNHPSPPLLRHAERIVSSALTGRSPSERVGKSTPVGRRDILIASTVWHLRRSNKGPTDAARIAARRWNLLVGRRSTRCIRDHTALRAMHQHDWVRRHEEILGDCILADKTVLPHENPCAEPLKRHVCKTVDVPLECLIEVPDSIKPPADPEDARSLCRAFCIAVKNHRVVAMPGLLPYIAAALRRALDGLEVSRAFGLVRDRSGRTARGGALDGWPTRSDRDERDRWLAAEVLRLQKSDLHHDAKMTNSKAAERAAQRWSRLHPGRAIGKDTARRTTQRWGEYMRMMDASQRAQDQREQNVAKLTETLAQISSGARGLWDAIMLYALHNLLINGDDEVTLTDRDLKSFAAGTWDPAALNLDEALRDLENAGLVRIVRSHGRRQCILCRDAMQSDRLALSAGPIATFDTKTLPVAADADHPIYRPRK